MWKRLKNQALVAKIAVDTGENGPRQGSLKVDALNDPVGGTHLHSSPEVTAEIEMYWGDITKSVISLFQVRVFSTLCLSCMPHVFHAAEYSIIITVNKKFCVRVAEGRVQHV